MTIPVVFRCGHRGLVATSLGATPTCPTCGTVGVSRVNAPAPTFTGHCRGPVATFQELDPITVSLKEEPHG